MSEQRKNGGVFPRTLSLIAALSAAIFSVAGYLLYRHEAHVIRLQKHAELESISRLKAEWLRAWRKERINDTRLNATGLVRELAREWLKAPGDLSWKAALQARMRAIREEYGYSDAILVSPEGRLKLSLSDHFAKLEPDSHALVLQAVAQRKTLMGDLFRCPACGGVHLDAVAPIFGPDGRPIAALILRTDPKAFFFPLLQSWPVPSRTAETLLVRREGEEVLFLNQLRHRPDPPLTFSLPMSRTDSPAIQAVLGNTGVFAGRDYRGEEVLSDTRPVQDTDWLLVSKVDAEEFLSELAYRGGVIAVFVVLAILLASSAGFLAHGVKQRRLIEDAFRARRERDEAVQEGERKFQRMVEDLGREYFFYRHGADGVFTYVSPSVKEVLGYGAEEFRRHYSSYLTDDPLNQEAVRHTQASIRGEQPPPYPVSIRHKDGSIRTLRVTEHPVFGRGGKAEAVEGLACDVTESRRSEARMHSLLGILQHPATDVQGFLDFALHEALKLTASKIGYIYHYYEDRRQFVLNSWSKDVMRQCSVPGAPTVYDLDKTGVWGEAVRQRKPIILNDFPAPHPMKKGLPEGHAPLRRFMTVPVFRGERIVAVVGVANKETDYDEGDTLQLSLLMGAVWKSVERKEAETDLERQRQEFFQLLSHDLKTPLAAIFASMSMVGEMLSGTGGAALRSLLDIAMRNCNEMLDLIKGVLDQKTFSASLRSGLVLQPLDAEAHIRRIVESLESTARVKRVTLRLECGLGGAKVTADKRLLYRIATNLLSNAIKFSPEGGEVIVGLSRVGPGVRLEVADRGPGIPDEFKDKVFIPRAQARAEDKTDKGGEGLGLAGVSQMVAVMNGSIGFDSVPGVKTTFFVTLPLAGS